jgi:membrane fusion protein (multidrug efflux system)
MTIGFPRSIRALSADNRRGRIWSVLLSATLLTAWGGWLFGAEITMYVKTERARLEATGQPHAVETQVAGRVAVSHIVLGQRVEKGALLLEIDAQEFVLELSVREARIKGLREELAALARVLDAEQQVLAELDHSYRAQLEEKRVQRDKAASEAAFAAEKASRMSSVKGHGLPELAVMNAENEAAVKKADVQAKGLSVKVLSANKQTEKTVRIARIAEFDKERARLSGELEISEAGAVKLRDQIERHKVVAPVTGQIGEVAQVVEGAFVQAGKRLATIIPDGELIGVARFSAYDSVGRIKPGQAARLRLAAFPWTQYGSVVGQIRSVATEPHDGLVQVEMRIDRTSSARIPYQHGLSGSLEVAVERISPAEIVLRAAGRLLAGQPISNAPHKSGGAVASPAE